MSCVSFSVLKNFILSLLSVFSSALGCAPVLATSCFPFTEPYCQGPATSCEIFPGPEMQRPCGILLWKMWPCLMLCCYAMAQFSSHTHTPTPPMCAWVHRLILTYYLADVISCTNLMRALTWLPHRQITCLCVYLNCVGGVSSLPPDCWECDRRLLRNCSYSGDERSGPGRAEGAGSRGCGSCAGVFELCLAFGQRLCWGKMENMLNL